MTVALEQGTHDEIQMDVDAVVAQIQEAKSKACVDAYHALWYHATHTWPMTRYKGVPILKAPNDLHIYHELLWQLRPMLVIETGTCFGGSALWFADQLEPWGGRVISIDLHDKKNPSGIKNPSNTWPDVQHDRIDWVVNSSLDLTVIQDCTEAADTCGGRVVVSLDSDHRAAHVAQELEAYAPLVTPGSYCVVEDTNVSGRPIVANDPGPGAAVDAFLSTHPEFKADALCERYLMTMHPGGWLARVE